MKFSIVFCIFFFLSFFLYANCNEGNALVEQASEYFYTQNVSQAAVLFERAINEGNVCADTFLYLAFAYEDIGTLSRAVDVLEQGVQFSNEKQVFHFNLANIHARQSNFQRALEEYERALFYDNRYSAAYLNIANIYLHQQNYTQAVQNYENFVRYDPGHALTPRVQSMIDALRENIAAEELRAQEAEAQRQALLLEILGNLEDAEREDPSIGAGTEDISGNEDIFLRAE